MTDPDPQDLDDMFDDSTEVVSPLTAGSFFGDRFRIEGPLGVGGMSTVYAAVDLKHDERPVALKVLLKSSANEETRQRFEREYEILSSIHHHGIVAIHGYGYANGRTPWLAMEHLDGETLGARIRRDGPLSPSQLVPILEGAAEALEAAHAAGVVHRDLKPDHLFLPDSDAGPSVKLLDFGLSLATHASKKLTATGTVLGTPRYMSPEQIASAHDAGAPTDVYALAVIAYEALTGDSPFSASDQGQLLGAILTGNTRSLAEARPELDPLFDVVVKRAMHHDVKQRTDSPRAFAKSFAEAASGRASMTHLPAARGSSLPPRSSRAPEPPSWGVFMVIAVLCGLGAAAFTFWLTR